MIDDSPHRTRVLGLGNPIRGDDGVGWRVVEVGVGVDRWCWVERVGVGVEELG